MSQDAPLTLKGTPQGLLLHPRTNDWDALLRALEHSLRDAATFFKGGRVIVELGGRPLPEPALIALRTVLENYDIALWAVLGGDEETQRYARSHGIRTRLPGEAAPEAAGHAPEEPQAAALFIQRTLRSGQKINVPGHVTVLGDVNPGAEIVAGGHIIVWGKVLGIVHAGALGDEGATVCALDLNPSQLRIAGYISRAPDSKRRKPHPEMAYIQQEKIIAIPWNSKG